MIKLSIIICTYNRAKYLPEALESLKTQNLSKNEYEIILINNNSTDNTEEIGLNFKNANPDLNYKYDIEKNQGLSYARNKGIEVSEGSFIAFIDDDGRSEEDYAENLIAAFNNYPKYDAIGGKVLPIYPNSKEPEWMSSYIQGVVSKSDYGEEFGEFVKSKYPVGCNMAFRKEVFDELGGFNVNLTLRNDDKYIFLKLRKNSKKVLYAPNVIVHHHIDDYRLTPDFIKQLSFLIGSTEKDRLKTEPFYLSIIKPIEYLFKFGASLLIGIKFLVEKQYLKAYYIIRIRFFVLIGFFK